MFARIWKLIGLRGVVAIAFAAVLLVSPDIGLTAMTIGVGVVAIVGGLVSAAGVSALPRGAKSHRRWLTAHAVVGVLGGTAMLVWPDVSEPALLYAVALWAIVVGVIELVAAFALPLDGGQTLLVALGGVALAAIGVVMFVDPGNGAIAILTLVSAVVFVRGVSDVALSVQLRQASGELDKSFRSLTGVTQATRV